MSQNSFIDLLTQIYKANNAKQIEPRLRNLITRYQGRIPTPVDTLLSEHDLILITYGDQVRQPGLPHLHTLTEFCEAHLRGLVSGVHILPFFPWSSDDGFSVRDYRAVDSSLGDWQDIQHLGQSFRLMFDGVINHASAQGEWFRAFLRNEAPYRDYFLTVEGNPDLSRVVRPRTLPLITEFQTTSGIRKVWTTFSADQVDLDFHNPDVLLEIFDILLMYAERGAQFIRLDAIAYLWKEIGTTCLHLPQVHAVVQLLRAVLDEAAPHVRIITETNVPHRDNISYFGDGRNEAQLVYNFALPPLVLHTIRSGDATVLSEWAAGLELPSNQTTFFNFLASHDGIGLNPAREILSTKQIDGLVEQTIAHGGLISFKQNSDGSQSPYEMNINYFDALSNPAGGEPIELQVDRFMAAQAIMLSLRGIPGIYFHSLFGSRGWKAGWEQSGHNRTINRQKLDRTELEADLADQNSLRSQVFERYRQLLVKRASSPAFHPHGGQTIEPRGSGIFAVLRSSPDNSNKMLCLQNVTARTQSTGEYQLDPYQTLWVDLP
jgi:glucosylglycerate phosphorylase